MVRQGADRGQLERMAKKRAGNQKGLVVKCCRRGSDRDVMADIFLLLETTGGLETIRDESMTC